jgi:hypothetical protein
VFLAGKISRKNGQDKCLLKEIQLEAQSVLSQSKFFSSTNGFDCRALLNYSKKQPSSGNKKGLFAMKF